MHELSDLLLQNQPQEPAEIAIIKKFVHEHFQADCTVTARPSQIIIGVKSAALAGALRMRLHELKEACGAKGRFLIRIG